MQTKPVKSRDSAEPLGKAMAPTDHQPPRRSLHPGDEVYFSDDSGNAQYGTVAAVGQHGVTIDSQGEDGRTTTYKVRHQNIVGHRKRAERKLVVIDRGEDGAIAIDEDEKRVFVRGHLDALEQGHNAPNPLSKALAGTVETAEDARLLALVLAAVEPLQAAMQAMQEAHQHEMERLARLVEAIATRLPLALEGVRAPDGSMITHPATEAELADVAS